MRGSPFGNTTGLKRLIRREVIARSETLTGTVVSEMKMVDDDGLGSSTWAVDVVIGKLRPLRNVQVKAGADGSRFYAGMGQTVKLARNTLGRFDVIGPGDTVTNFAVVKKYNLGDPTPVSTSNLGLEVRVEPFEFLKGPTPGVPGTSRWGNGSTPLKTIRIVDADGNPV